MTYFWNTTKGWETFAKLPLIIGAVIAGIFPILTFLQVLPFWGLFLGLIPVIFGSFLTSILRQMEYKPGEPSRKCVRCGLTVYISSMDEHLKLCEG